MQTTLPRPFRSCRLVPRKILSIARSKAIAGAPPHNNVVAARRGELQRSPANRHVFLTTCQGVSATLPRAVLAPSAAVVPLKACQRRVTDSER